MRLGMVLCLFVLAGCGPALAADFQLVPGSFVPNKGPDGNSVFLDTERGLVLVDTGRHPAHRDKLLAYAKERGRPIVAVFNTHWHLDHTTGNAEIRAAYPQARVYGTSAIDGAVVGFFPASRKGAEEFLKSGEASPEQRAEMERGFYVMDHPETLRATDVIDSSRRVTVDGRNLDVRISKFAATEGDLWLIDPAEKLAIVGDLVVATMPFMDTACPDGWKAALGEVAAADWQTLIPGHGEAMTRPQFEQWRTAFGNLVDCGRSSSPIAQCADGWVRDARPFIAQGDEKRMASMVEYYVTTRLRSSPEEQQKYCRPLAASAAPERG
jgi:glyoxylase-like metal-dependent hydrolase (beta-lactamase superfamily II)